MKHLHRPSPLIALLVVAITSLSGIASACQVPVFRFALERWVADPYEITITPGSGGEFTADEQAAIDFLQSSRAHFQNTGAADGAGGFANLRVTIAEKPAESFPVAMMVVGYPQKIRGFNIKSIWEGPVTLENARRLVDSPVRRELVKRILHGESAIWLVVESGNAEADDAAAAIIEEAITRAEETLKVPDGVMTRDQAESAKNFASINADDILRSEVPLKIDFSMIRVARDDPAEALLLAMLLNVEEDLEEYAGDPMVFPVFGRGRFLEPILGKGVNVDNALEYATYISGACSCEVKDQNPGLDLLVAADWDTALEGSEVVIEKILPPLEGTGILAQAAKPGDPAKEGAGAEAESGLEGAVDPAVETDSASETGGDVEKGSYFSLLMVVVVLFVVIGAGTVVLLARKRS